MGGTGDTSRSKSKRGSYQSRVAEREQHRPMASGDAIVLVGKREYSAHLLQRHQHLLAISIWHTLPVEPPHPPPSILFLRSQSEEVRDFGKQSGCSKMLRRLATRSTVYAYLRTRQSGEIAAISPHRAPVSQLPRFLSAVSRTPEAL